MSSDFAKLFRDEFTKCTSMFQKRDLLLSMQKTNMELQKELFKLMTGNNNSQFLLTGINPEPVKSKPRKQINKELKEGFWYPAAKNIKYYKDDQGMLSYPRVVDYIHKRPMQGLEKFLNQLARVENIAARTCYKGWSTCRICGKRNGSKTFRYKGMVWPEGYAHYIKEHNVWPSEQFRLTILDYKERKTK